MDVQRVRRTVVVGVDGSRSALRAVRWGLAEARRQRTPLRLVTAFAWPVEHDHSHPGRGDSYRDMLRARAGRQLAQAAVEARREGPDVKVDQQLIVGHPVDVLAAETRHAQLVVIGDRGMGRVEGLLLGSVAVALVAHASCPVVLVRGTVREPSEIASLPVVVGVEESPTCDAAIGFAFAAAVARRVPLVAVHTWWGSVFDPVVAAVLLDWDGIEADERHLLSRWLAGWIEKYPDVTVEQRVTRGDAAHSLLGQAARAQLVVVGSRGHGEFSGAILGSVSNALLHRAPCPVAVVRTDTEACTLPSDPGRPSA